MQIKSKPVISEAKNENAIAGKETEYLRLETLVKMKAHRTSLTQRAIEHSCLHIPAGVSTSSRTLGTSRIQPNPVVRKLFVNSNFRAAP